MSSHFLALWAIAVFIAILTATRIIPWQLIGWTAVAGCLFLGSLVYTVKQQYYHNDSRVNTLEKERDSRRTSLLVIIALTIYLPGIWTVSRIFLNEPPWSNEIFESALAIFSLLCGIFLGITYTQLRVADKALKEFLQREKE